MPCADRNHPEPDWIQVTRHKELNQSVCCSAGAKVGIVSGTARGKGEIFPTGVLSTPTVYLSLFRLFLEGQYHLPVVCTPFVDGEFHHLVESCLCFVHQLLRVLESPLAFLILFHLSFHHFLLFGKEGLRLGEVFVQGAVAFFLIS